MSSSGWVEPSSVSLRLVVRSLGRQLPLKRLVCGQSGPELEFMGSILLSAEEAWLELEAQATQGFRILGRLPVEGFGNNLIVVKNEYFLLQALDHGPSQKTGRPGEGPLGVGRAGRQGRVENEFRGGTGMEESCACRCSLRFKSRVRGDVTFSHSPAGLGRQAADLPQKE